MNRRQFLHDLLKYGVSFCVAAYGLGATKKAMAGFGYQVVGGLIKTPTGEPTFTLQEDNNGETYDSYRFNFTAAKDAATNFTASGSYTITKIAIPMWKVGNPTFGMTIGIYTNNSGNPGTLIGTASDEVLASSLPTSESTMVEFTGISASVTSSTLYFVRLHKSSGSDNFYVDYIRWPYQSNGVGTTYYLSSTSDGGSTWDLETIEGYNMPGKMEIYSTP